MAPRPDKEGRGSEGGRPAAVVAGGSGRRRHTCADSRQARQRPALSLLGSGLLAAASLPAGGLPSTVTNVSPKLSTCRAE